MSGRIVRAKVIIEDAETDELIYEVVCFQAPEYGVLVKTEHHQPRWSDMLDPWHPTLGPSGIRSFTLEVTHMQGRKEDGAQMQVRLGDGYQA